MKNIFSNVRTEKGAALIEYGMIVGLISILAIASVLAVGDRVKSIFNTAQTTLSQNIFASEDDVEKEEKTPLVAVSFTAGTSSEGSRTGYSRGNESQLPKIGEHSSITGDFGDDVLAITTEVAAPHRLTVQIRGDRVADLDGASITCTNGLNYTFVEGEGFSDPNRIFYREVIFNRTYALREGLSQSDVFQDGTNFECEIKK